MKVLQYFLQYKPFFLQQLKGRILIFTAVNLTLKTIKKNTNYV